MSVSNQVCGPFAAGLLRLVLAMVALTCLWGCSQQDSIQVLRDIGAEIKQDDDDNVTDINFPTHSTGADEMWIRAHVLGQHLYIDAFHLLLVQYPVLSFP